ncbi:MAG: DUF5627 domain-containing protein [Clostridium sp.]|nr:DUF5627 domain-containing protein [Clostridium sp.]
MKNLYKIMLGAAFAAGLTACENGNQEFEDFDTQNVYFAYQTPVLTLSLGEDGDFDTSLDNEHKFEVYVTLGGVNTNKENRTVEVAIDNSLVDGLTFDDGSPVLALPQEYYSVVGGTTITIPKGKVMGAIMVQLNDAFFNDPKAAELNYVLPVRIVKASTDILAGTPVEGVADPNPVNSADWSVQPKDYTLYGVKFKNTWTGSWLSRGTETTTINGTATVREHNAGYWEKEEIHYLTCNTISTCIYTMSTAVPQVKADGSMGELTIKADLLLSFAGDGGITVTSATPGITASGTGKYTYHGAAQAWGGKDRDLIELEFSYSTPYDYNLATGEAGSLAVSVKETMVYQSKLNKLETFTYKVN